MDSKDIELIKKHKFPKEYEEKMIEELSDYERINLNGFDFYLKKDKNGKWSIYKSDLIGLFSLFSKIGISLFVGHINTYGAGKKKKTVKLSYYIKEEHREKGIMKNFLREYIKQQGIPKKGYELKILKDNIGSLKVAEFNKFKIFDESKKYYNFILKQD